MPDVNLGRLFVTLEGKDVGLKQLLTDVRQQIGQTGAVGRQLASDLSPQAYLNAFKSGLIGIVGPAAAAGVAIGAVKGTIDSFVDAFNFKSQLDLTTRSIEIQLQGVRDQGKAFADAKRFGDDFKLTQEQITGAMQASIPIMRTSNQSTYDIIGTLSRLQVLKPEKSIQDAARALSELKAGQVESIVEQFNISRSAANQMRKEIAGGADAVEVLSRYLEKAGVGMDALKVGATGTNGALRDLARAQEEMKLAQAEWAQGPGLFILDQETRVARGLTRVLGGGGGLSEAIRQVGMEWSQAGTYSSAFLSALAQGKSQAEANAIAQQALANSSVQSAQAWTSGGGQMIQTTAALDGATQNLNVALTDAMTRQMESTTAANQLSAAQATLASLGNQVAQGLMTSSAAAAQLTAQYGIATDAALQLVAAQAMIAQQKLNSQALADYRRGERGDERSQQDYLFDLKQQTRDREAQAQSNFLHMSKEQQIAYLREQASHLRAGSADRLALEDRAYQLQQANQTKSHAGKLGAEQKFNNQMLNQQAQFDDQVEAREREHQRRLNDIQDDAEEKRAAQARQNEVSKRTSRADFYDQLSGAQGIDPAKFAAAYEEAYAKAQEIAQQGNRKLSEDYLAMRQRQIQADEQYDREAADVQKDDTLSKRERQARLQAIEERRRLRQEANAEEQQQLLAAGDQINAEEQRQLDEENKRYQEATDEAGAKYDALADRRIAAHQRANGAIAAVLPAELNQARQVGASAGVPTAAPTASDILSVKDAGVISAIGEQTGTLKDALEGVRRAVESVERAVGRIHLEAGSPVA
jgi:hypothetical protein